MGALALATILAASLAHAQMPPPQPVERDVKVCCYYFPGHFHAGRWSPMKSYGHPVPVLGYYRDGAPGVADWHIKWAVEHGISCFVFDWYYDHHTGRVSGHNTALDEGFLKAEHQGLMEFAIFWCNEEGLGEAPYSEEQMLTLARTLGERYFGQPNYLQIDGRPALFVSVPERLRRSFGDGFPSLLSRMSREAGLPEGRDIYLVGKQSTNLDQLEQTGFSACTAYNYAGTRASEHGSPLRATYDDMVEGYEMMWKRVTEDGTLPYIVPISPGWDSRPWYGPRALVRTQPTAAKFLDMCRRAKPYIDPDLNMVIAECWNEFGEGSFLEPTVEHGFGALDAMREVFAKPGDWPENTGPAENEKRAWVYDEIPEVAMQAPPGADLLQWGDMEDEQGWIAFNHDPLTFSPDQPRSGERCLVVEPGKHAKSMARCSLDFGKLYRVSAWVRCSEGAHVRVTCALFGRNGKWMGSYVDVGDTTSGDWVEVTGVIPGVDPGVAAVDVEFVASNGACFADDVSVTIVGDAEVHAPAFEDDCSGPEAWVMLDGSAPRIAEGAIHLPAGSGVKTHALFPTGPGQLYVLTASVKCDNMATVELRAAEFGGDGSWLKSYVVGDKVSWQEWVEVTSVLSFPADTEAASCNLEAIALGGEAWVRDIRLQQGRALERR